MSAMNSVSGGGQTMQDSGERRAFPGGAVRESDKGKARPDLISPHALMRVGRWMALGASKYGERNWEKGMPNDVLYASMMRHMLKYAMGERDEDHLSAIVFNCQALLHFEETGSELLLSAMGDADRHAEKRLVESELAEAVRFKMANLTQR